MQEPEARFDDITSLCSLVFKVPIALVSLVDENVQVRAALAHGSGAPAAPAADVAPCPCRLLCLPRSGSSRRSACPA